MNVINTLASYLFWEPEEQQNAPSGGNSTQQNDSNFNSRYGMYLSAETHPRETFWNCTPDTAQCFPKDRDAPKLDPLKLAVRTPPPGVEKQWNQ